MVDSTCYTQTRQETDGGFLEAEEDRNIKLEMHLGPYIVPDRLACSGAEGSDACKLDIIDVDQLSLSMVNGESLCKMSRPAQELPYITVELQVKKRSGKVLIY